MTYYSIVDSTPGTPTYTNMAANITMNNSLGNYSQNNLVHFLIHDYQPKEFSLTSSLSKNMSK